MRKIAVPEHDEQIQLSHEAYWIVDAALMDYYNAMATVWPEESRADRLTDIHAVRLRFVEGPPA